MIIIEDLLLLPIVHSTCKPAQVGGSLLIDLHADIAFELVAHLLALFVH
jgi:hypothetical protein